MDLKRHDIELSAADLGERRLMLAAPHETRQQEPKHG
jgi:hypothetical protein